MTLFHPSFATLAAAAIALGSLFSGGTVSDLDGELDVSSQVSTFKDKDKDKGKDASEVTVITSMETGLDFVGSEASILRSAEGIHVNGFTSEYIPGDAVNLFLVSYDFPDECVYGEPITGASCGPDDWNVSAVSSSVLLLDSQVVPADGVVSFGSYFAFANDVTLCIPSAPCNIGISNTLGSEVHLMLRTHGEASSDPTVLDSQLTTYGSGCDVSTGCKNVQAGVFDIEKDKEKDKDKDKGKDASEVTVITSMETGLDFVGSEASILRSAEGIHVNGFTSEYIPGDAVNLFLVSYDFPDECVYGEPITGASCGPDDWNVSAVSSSVLLLDSQVVPADGVVSFGSYFAFANDVTLCIPSAPCNIGISNTLGSEVHLMLRTHGEASSDPTVLDSQLTTYGSGCDVSTGCKNVQAGVFAP
ncbi:hypothetical protein ARHIZOSPH14_13100 [Agromyces rhizosphaerae]|uniref:Uncharacterized protein n=1 Tax=Agromyces rhizosphaerae TaxID=88374 RepID=A0A9W6D069_9MICO|nr:hypothetical protein [Agromyces rhizosphaerae]GLI27068.1 hypothetical protein ARHIZOSPH14_13100 [Agromyces rhizosphaerae]